MRGLFAFLRPKLEHVMSETSVQIHAELEAISQVTNPATGSTSPKKTTRAPAEVHADLVKVEGLFSEFKAAVRSETGKTYPLNGHLWDDFEYAQFHFRFELGFALRRAGL